MKLKILGAVALCCALAVGATTASAAGDVIRIGVLNDQSGVFADNGGVGSAVAPGR